MIIKAGTTNTVSFSSRYIMDIGEDPAELCGGKNAKALKACKRRNERRCLNK